MKYLAALFLIFGFGLSGLAQTIKSLGYNTTNGQVVANTGTNVLTFTNDVKFGNGDLTVSGQVISGGGVSLSFEDGALSGIISLDTSSSIVFQGASAAATRANLGFSTNLNTLWTATNASNARSAIGIGDTNAVAFSGIYNNGNFTNNNGTIYGFKTNVGPFEGIGNFFASNNTTVSNETLFRVGLAEATNKSAQFGFRVTRTNNGGEGVAVYSVFGYNALMMIGPSDRSRTNYATNTNAGVEATLWTITPTNQVMTLRDTNTGATTLHQSLGFDTNVTSTAPANTTNIVKWIEVWVGTNSYRMPLYQ